MEIFIHPAVGVLCCPQSATALQTPQRDHDVEREDEYDSNDFITPSARSDAEDGEWVEDAHDALRGNPTGQVGGWYRWSLHDVLAAVSPHNLRKSVGCPYG